MRLADSRLKKANEAAPANSTAADIKNQILKFKNQALQNEALGDILRAGGLSLAVGAGARGMFGLMSDLTEDPKKRELGTQNTVLLPYPVRKSVDSTFGVKVAGDGDPGDLFSGWGSASAATTKPGIPWYIPGMAGVALGGLYTGYKGLDYLLDARRKTEQENELEKAREEYSKALLGQYAKPIDSPVMKKRAEAENDLMVKVSQELDEIFDHLDQTYELEKHAVFENTVAGAKNLANTGLGAYATYAGLTTLLGGIVAYNKMRARSKEKILEEAIAQREREQFNNTPIQVYGMPQQVTSLPKMSPSTEANLIKANADRFAHLRKRLWRI